MLVFENLTIKDLKNHYFIEDFSYSLGNMERLVVIGEDGKGKVHYGAYRLFASTASIYLGTCLYL